MDVRRRLVRLRCARHARVYGGRVVSGDGHRDGWKRGNGLLLQVGDDLRHQRHRERVPDERRRDHGLHVHGIGERRQRLPVFVLVDVRGQDDGDRFSRHPLVHRRGQLFARSHCHRFPRRHQDRTDADRERLGTPAPLGATVNAPRQAADVGQSVSFTCSATGGAAPYSYRWTFGDGNAGSGSAVSHVYQSAGAMTVTCTATDSASATAAASTSVDVSSSPSVAAYANPSAAAPGTSLTFSAQATGGPGSFTGYTWSLGDGATGSGIQVAHAFAQPASYQASVVVTDANGGTASGSVSVTIANIQVTASGAPASGNTDTSFEFSATATGGGGDPFSYSWDFGDGQ